MQKRKEPDFACKSTELYWCVLIRTFRCQFCMLRSSREYTIYVSEQVCVYDYFSSIINGVMSISRRYSVSETAQEILRLCKSVFYCGFLMCIFISVNACVY